MALAIDTRHLLEHWLPRQEDFVSGTGLNAEKKRLLQLHKVYSCATVVLMQDAPRLERLDLSKLRPKVKQEALDWQADQDVDLDDGEVFLHLSQMGDATASSFPQEDCLNARTTTLVASVQSPEFAAHAQGRPPSSFHRFSYRFNMLTFYDTTAFRVSTYNLRDTDIHKILPNALSTLVPLWPLWVPRGGPEIVWANRKHQFPVLWQLQLDFVDLSSASSRGDGPSPAKRGRYGPYLQVYSAGVEETTSRENHQVSQAKTFKGVRFRRDRRAWVAEMKLPKSKNKVSFGDFKCPTQAARAIDAAFHHYGKPHLLNFADTPHILSTELSPAGLNEENKLALVKQQAKWLASIASTLPPTPSSATAMAASVSPGIPELPSGYPAITRTSGFRSLSEITSSLCSGGTDEADDGISQPQWNPIDAMAGSCLANGWVETLNSEPSNFGGTDREEGVVNESEEPGRSLLDHLWSAEKALLEDIPEHFSGVSRSFGNSPGVEQPCGQLQSICMGSFRGMSPPPPNLFQMASSRDFQGDAAD